MAHQINQMVYVGQEPWHGLGVRLPANGTFEEIVQAAGFYQAIERHVFVAGHFDHIRDRKALVRGDNGQYLSVVGKGYQVVQFEDVARTLSPPTSSGWNPSGSAELRASSRQP